MEKDNSILALRWIAGLGCLTGLVCVFVFQQFNFAALIGMKGGVLFYFFVNRTVRFFLNDGLTIGLIWALFYKRDFVIFSLWVQLFGMVFILFPYFILKIYYPAYSGPLLSFIHRLILNPTLLLLLIPALYYQQKISDEKK